MISVIVAYDRNRAIGRRNDIPWHLSDDLKRFKAITMGHAVIMGRNTWDSLPFKPLKGRRNIVVSTSMQPVDGIEIVRSLKEAVALVQPDEEAFIMGGAKIYEQSVDFADRLIITHVDLAVEDADRFFPPFDINDWQVQDSSEELTDPSGIKFRYVTYIRK